MSIDQNGIHSGDREKATASKNPLESLLSNPQIAIENRKLEEKPVLKIFAG
jgi:hypothetical protein